MGQFLSHHYEELVFNIPPHIPLPGEFDLKGIMVVEILPDVVQGPEIVVVSHGNGSDNSIHYQRSKKMADNLKRKVVMYDYPGYGGSQGQPSEEGCIEALVKVFDCYCQHPIILYGASLGGGVTWGMLDYFRYHHPGKLTLIQSVVIVSSFTSLPELMYFSSSLENWAYQHRCVFDSRSRAFAGGFRLIFFHSPEDCLIPVWHAQEMARLTHAPLMYLTGDHMDTTTMIFDDPRLYTWIQEGMINYLEPNFNPSRSP